MISFKIPKYALCACQMLAVRLLLSGCGARYSIKGHRSYAGSSEAIASSSQYPTLIMEKGDLIRAVTPAKGPLFGGYWQGIYVENAEVARHLPRDGDFFNGTDIEAVGVGRTKAYYLNAVYLMSEVVETTYIEDADWFWIEVVETGISE